MIIRRSGGKAEQSILLGGTLSAWNGGQCLQVLSGEVTVKRPGIIAAGLLSTATVGCLLFQQQLDLGASEDERGSFREAFRATAAETNSAAKDGIRLNYFDATWDRVLGDFAEHQSLTLVMDRVPSGRFARRDRNFHDSQGALRILNSELEQQGFRLLVQNHFLIVLDLDQARTQYARPRLQPEVAQQARSGMRTAATAEDPRTPPSLPALDSRQPRVPQSPASQIRRAGGRVDDTARSFDTLIPGASARRPIQQVSGLRGRDDERPAAAQEADILETVPLSDANAAAVARTLFVVFKGRAELEREGLNNLPGFTVFSNNAEEEDDPTVLFRVAIDQNRNALTFSAPARRMQTLRRLVSDLDRPAEFASDSDVRLIPNNSIPVDSVEQLSTRLTQLVAMADEQRSPVAYDEGDPGTAASADESPAINLRGEVTVQAMQDLQLLILKGNAADVDRVEGIIQQLENVSVGSLPSIHILALQNVDSEAMATLLEEVYTQLATLREQSSGSNRKTASFLPVVQPNALLIISSEVERESILDLASTLDAPTSPDLEFEVFPLKSAIASQVVTSLTSFYEERPGLGTSLRTFADVRTNSVIVQGRPNELEEVRKLISRIDQDTPAATSMMRVIRLRNSVAEELSTTINQAIQAVISPPQQTTGGQAGFGGFGNQQGAQELRDNKSVAVEFLSSAGGVRELIRSGILADIRVSFDARSNSLIVTAPEASMGLMEALIRELDQTPDATSEIKVFTLQNADAQQSVDLLTTLFEDTNQQDQLGVQLAGTEGSSSSLIPMRFSADIRTNTVLAVGSAESLSVVEAVLLRLDSDDTRQRSTSVIPLRNAPAELVSETLLDFLDQQQALQDSSEDLISNIQRIRQEVLVSPDTNSNSLIVSASPQYFSQILQIIDQLDAQPPEVVIQALLVEVTLDATDEFGIELGFQDPLLLNRSLNTSTAGGQTSITAGPGLNFNNTQLPLGGNYLTEGTLPGTLATQGLSNFSLGRSNTDLGFGGFVFSAQSDAVSVLLRALAARRTVQILSRPQVRTTHNNEAYVTVGQQVPRVNGATPTQFGATPQVTNANVGITLRVTPRITPDGIIAMNVFADKSSLSANGVPIFVNGDGSAIESPIINQSQALTTVNVPNGQTIVIGGMITKSDASSEAKVPWLGDLPIIGQAFRYDSNTSARTELLIFLTPRIVLSDLDSELIKQVESERMHFLESDAEDLHGPLFSVPGADDAAEEELPQSYFESEPMPLTPDMDSRELLEPEAVSMSSAPAASRRRR